MDDNDWKQQIRIKMTDFYANDRTKFDDYMSLIMFFNAEVTKEESSPYYTSPFNQTLKMALESGKDHVFLEYCERMMTDVKEFTNDPELRKVMEEIYSQFVEPDFLQHQEGMLSIFRAKFKEIIVTPLSRAILSFDCIRNIRLWWKGDISGKRCAKVITDSLTQLAGTVGGVVGCALLGGLVLPGVGLVVGGAIGGSLFGFSARVVSEYVTKNIFDLPKEVALENAYRFLGVHWKASNSEINKAYHRLLLKYHPDTKGNENECKKLMFYMEIIRKARE